MGDAIIMSINVYWSTLEKEWMRATTPKSVLKNFYDKRLHDEKNANFHRCPFSYEHLKNVYSLQSLYDYSFSLEDELVSSKEYDQNFFNEHVIVRSIKSRLFSFSQSFIFFTDEKSLSMSIPQFPYMEDNNITKRCIPIVGSIDIGKYFRVTDFAFFLKKEYDSFVIEKEEIFAYIEFNTNEKINFKQFYPTEKIKEYSVQSKNAALNKKISFSSSENFYKNFKIKKHVLEEIKNNLV